MSAPTNRHRLAMSCAWVLIVFNVLFPKGGIKVSIPLTWGYLLMGITSPPLIIARVLAMPLRIKRTVLVAAGLLLPFQLLYMYSAVFFGIGELGYAISTALNIFFFPLMFYLIYPGFYPSLDGERLSSYFRWCVLLAAFWGIFLFFWHPLTGHFIEIPYLTVNVADYGELENTKRIARGTYLKLISTYNNGNLYGVCMMIVLPLYNRLEPARWRRNVLRLALVLTLSRTVWFTLVLEQLLSMAVVFAKQVDTFPRLYLGTAAKRVGMLVLTIVCILLGLMLNANSLAFLFDSTAGGRVGQFALFANTTLLPSRGILGFGEVVYASAAQNMGYAGLVAFCLMMFGPLIVLLFDTSAFRSELRRAALKGLLLYACMAAVDGAYDFIPAQAFYFFTYMIFLYGWPQAWKDRISVPAAQTEPVISASNLAEA